MTGTDSLCSGGFCGRLGTRTTGRGGAGARGLWGAHHCRETCRLRPYRTSLQLPGNAEVEG